MDVLEYMVFQHANLFARVVADMLEADREWDK